MIERWRQWRLSNRLSEHDALFVECKPVDATHAAGGKYCDDGLCRFVGGDYAWAMEEGLMLGYARDGRTIASHLVPAMQQDNRIIKLKIKELPHAVKYSDPQGPPAAEKLHISIHERGFVWPDGKGIASKIAIYHLWCDCG